MSKFIVTSAASPFVRGHRGLLGAEDQLQNLRAVRDGKRVFSAYELRDGTRI